MFEYTDKEYSIDRLKEILDESPHLLISKSEDFYHSQIKNAGIAAAAKKIVLLSGPSGSGKTTTAHKIKDELTSHGKKAEVVSLDNFYLDRDQLPIINGEPNAEVIEALNLPLLMQVMHEIVNTGSAYLPSFNFVEGKRYDNTSLLDIGDSGTVIFEGIHALNRKITESFAKAELLNVYVSPHSSFSCDGRIIISKREMRFLRRLVRDSWSRGASPFLTYEMWDEVCDGEDKYIRPNAVFADIHINTTHAYEPFIIHDKAQKLLEMITDKSEYYENSRAMIGKLSYFYQLPNELLPNDSLLREFIGH